MSSDAEVAATVAVFNGVQRGAYCDLAGAVLFIYDAFVVFDREVAYFWAAKRISGASLLFLANKWISMAVYVIQLVQFASFSSDKRFVTHAMGTLQFVPGAAFSALRAYVLCRSKLLGLLVAASSLAPVGANLVSYGYQFTGVNVPPFGCLNTVNIPAALDLKFALFTLIIYIGTDSAQGVVTIVSRVPQIAADMILIYITWAKLRSSATLTDISQTRMLTLSDILFRGGTIYFVILFILNVLHLVLSATAVVDEGGDSGYSVITAFTAPITAIFISRFLLELQATNHMVVKLDANDPLHLSRNAWDGSTPSFISSLGGFVNPALSARSDDDDGVELEVQPEVAGEEKGRVQAEAPQVVAATKSETA
ncbi:hypothetical protein K466DRAFT_666334 [Polyporus arcularius HHB13444]|uniref:DUF6533 domain-containing protein n=1 Tax=Polyporus arcularius HHB13444 TaxID=1314778 RepID=A0A5C3NZB2_9APHY|nr:hypothetical protein K466DRAFT_666334 [Polyporus arcularius HHB13444]